MTEARGLASTDDLIREIAEAVAERLTALGLSGAELRERHHLDPFMKNEFERRTGVRPRARTLGAPDFVGVGPVDIVLAEPQALIELKWSYAMPPKIYESTWDAIKLVLLGQGLDCDALYIATGASREAWAASECADLFDAGEIDPAELWARPLVPRRGFNYGETVGQDCVIGGSGKQPVRAPSRIAVRSLARAPVAGDYELRVIGLTAVGPLRAWPRIEFLGGSSPEPDLRVSVELPARVTQRWVEQTAPQLHSAAQEAYIRALKARGWSDSELDERVRPNLPGLSDDPSAGDDVVPEPGCDA